MHIPYKGLAPAVSDLLGGQVQMMFAGISTVIQQVKAGKLVALAIASPRRNAQLPDVPTVAESGLPGFDVTSWYGFVVRSGTPPAIVDKIQRDTAEALRMPDVQSKLAALGLDPVGDTPAQFASVIDAETTKWVGYRAQGGYQAPAVSRHRPHVPQWPGRRAAGALRRRDPRRGRSGARGAGPRRDGDRAARAPRARESSAKGHFNVLRGYVKPLGVAGVKVVGDFVDNYKRGLPSEMALLNLFDPETGMPLADHRRHGASPTCAPAP